MDNMKLGGIFVQINEKGQYVYKDPFVKGGYLITLDKVKKYRIYALRYVLALLAAILVSTFIKDIRPALIVGLLTAIVGEILFRVKFLPSCTYLPNYVKDKNATLFKSIQKSTPTNKKIIKAVLFLALAILIVINAYQQNYPEYIIIGSWIVGVISLFMCIVYVIAIIKDGGNK